MLRHVLPADRHLCQIAAIAVVAREAHGRHRAGGHKAAHAIGCGFACLLFGGAERVIDFGRVIAEKADLVQHAGASQLQRKRRFQPIDLPVSDA